MFCKHNLLISLSTQTPNKANVSMKYFPLMKMSSPCKCNDGPNQCNVVCQWCRETSWHGWRHVGSTANRVASVFWVIIILIGLALLGFFIYDTARANCGLPKWSTTEFIQPVDVITIPPITVCSYNRCVENKSHVNILFSLSQRRLTASQLPQKDEVLSLLYWSIGGFTGLMADSSGIISADAALAYDTWRNTTAAYNNKTHVNKNINDFDSLFQTEIITDLAPLCADNFLLLIAGGNMVEGCNPTAEVGVSRVYTSEFGMCTRFNFSSSINISAPGLLITGLCSFNEKHDVGEANGVQLLLKTDFADIVNKLGNNYADDGVAIQIGDTLDYGNGWISASPGVHMKIALQRIQNKVIRPFLPINQPPCHEKMNVDKKCMNKYECIVYQINQILVATQ